MSVKKHGKDSLSIRVISLIHCRESALVEGRHCHGLNKADTLEGEGLELRLLILFLGLVVVNPPQV
jgi:hypothetical protein